MHAMQGSWFKSKQASHSLTGAIMENDECVVIEEDCELTLVYLSDDLQWMDEVELELFLTTGD